MEVTGGEWGIRTNSLWSEFAGFTIFQFRFYAIFPLHKLSKRQVTCLFADLTNTRFSIGSLSSHFVFLSQSFGPKVLDDEIDAFQLGHQGSVLGVKRRRC